MYVCCFFYSITLNWTGNNVRTRISGENSRVGFHNFTLKFAIKYFIIPPFLHQPKISIKGRTVLWGRFGDFQPAVPQPGALDENKKLNPGHWLDHKSSKTGQTNSSILSSQALLMIHRDSIPEEVKLQKLRAESWASLCYKLDEKYMMWWSGWDTGEETRQRYSPTLFSGLGWVPPTTSTPT